MRKKAALFLAMVLATGTACFAQYGGGLFQRGEVSDDSYYGYFSYDNTRSGSGLIDLPTNHGTGADADSNAPLGSGIAVLLTLGGAYLTLKKKEDKA